MITSMVTTVEAEVTVVDVVVRLVVAGDANGRRVCGGCGRVSGSGSSMDGSSGGGAAGAGSNGSALAAVVWVMLMVID